MSEIKINGVTIPFVTKYSIESDPTVRIIKIEMAVPNKFSTCLIDVECKKLQRYQKCQEKKNQ